MSWGYEQYYASPVSRDGFFYSGSGGMYVEIDTNRHSREDSRSLYSLLTYNQPPPVLTKAGKVAKRQPLPHKDPPGHFYCAQLLHYGLKPLKTKDAAKKRLLAAFDKEGNLAVPENIVKVEEMLKEEYARANEVAKEKYEREKELQKIEEEKKREKRKRNQDAIMQEFIDAGVRIRGGSNSGGLEVEDEDDSRASVKEQLRSAIATLPEQYLRRVVTNLVDQIPALEHAMMEEVGLGGEKKSAEGKKAKGKANIKKLELEGQFEIVAPYLSEQWPDYVPETITLKICPSSTSAHLWASFDFGIVSGIMRSSVPPPTTVGAVCPFIWRGRESGEGEMSLGEHNTGSITFLGGGKIKGQMAWMGGFEFVGKKVESRNVVWYKSVRGWKDKWRGMNERSYERERVGRWGGGGGWGWDGCEEKPAGSDTTDIGQGSESEEDGDYGEAY